MQKRKCLNVSTKHVFLLFLVPKLEKTRKTQPPTKVSYINLSNEAKCLEHSDEPSEPNVDANACDEKRSYATSKAVVKSTFGLDER